VRLLSEEKIDILVRMRIVDALGILGDLSIIDILEGLLSNSRVDARLRVSIVDTLGVLGECSDTCKLKIIHKLQAIFLRQDEDPDVRGHAATALGVLGDQSVANTMLKMLLQPDNDIFLSQKIVIALEKFMKRFPASELIETVSTQLLAMLSNSRTDSGIRIRIAWFMGTLGDRIQTSQTIDLLNIFSDFTVDSRVREAIVDALGRLGEQAVATGLYRSLSYPNIELNTRSHIAYALCLLHYENAFPIVLKFLSEENLDLQIRCLIADSLRALGEKIQPSEMISLLAKAEIHPTVRRHIADVLAEIVNDEASVLELAVLLQSSDIADDIHRTLWDVSRRIGVRIFMHNQGPEIIRWRDEFDG
jgi:HEAT repeat protein